MQARFCRLTSEDPSLLSRGDIRLGPAGYHKSRWEKPPLQVQIKRQNQAAAMAFPRIGFHANHTSILLALSEHVYDIR